MHIFLCQFETVLQTQSFFECNIYFQFHYHNYLKQHYYYQDLTTLETKRKFINENSNIDETIKAVGLEERITNFPSQISGGEQQRVAIARALAKNPKILLCDEPTGALDYNTGKQILKLLYDTCKEKKVTVVVITHNLAISAMGDKVIKVKNGAVESIVLNENPVSIDDIEW